MIFGRGYGFCFNCLFILLKPLIKCTQVDLGLGYVKDGSPHSESFYTLRTPNRTKRPISFFNISSCTFSTVYGREHIGLVSSFKSKYTGSVFQVPSVPSKNYSNFYNNFSNSLHCVIVKYWHWVSITLSDICMYQNTN